MDQFSKSVREILWQRARWRAERVLLREQQWQVARTRAERVLGREYDPDPPRENLTVREAARQLPNKYTGSDASAAIVSAGPVDNPLPRSTNVKYADNPLLWDAGLFKDKPEFLNVKVSEIKTTQDYIIPSRVAQYLLPDDKRPESTKKLTSIIRVDDEIVTVNGTHRVVAYWLRERPDIRVMDFGRWAKNGKWEKIVEQPKTLDLLPALLPLFLRGDLARRLAAVQRISSPSESDAELRARFQAASKDAIEWPGLRSEYDKETGKVDYLAAPIKLQAQEGTTPAARGKKTTISNPERLYATQLWLHRDPQRGYGGTSAMLPEHEAKYGKAPVVAETIDGRLHLLDGHHTVFYHLRDGGRALNAFVFQVQTAIFQDGAT